MARSAPTAALLDEVLVRFGVTNATMHDIRTGRVNKHWRIETNSRPYVLRRYRALRTPAAIEYEHAVLPHIEARGWPVAAPLRSRDGSTVVDADGRAYALFPFLPGRPAPRAARYTRLKGALLARLHQDLALWEAPCQRDGFGRTWELDLYVAANCQYTTLSDLLADFGKEHPDLARVIKSQRYAMLRELSVLGFGEQPAVLCHFDFFHDNLLFQRGSLSGLLDFDSVHLDSRVADIATSIFLDCLSPPAYSELSPALAAAFVAGYVEQSPLNDAELQLIVPLVRAAILGIIAWRLAAWGRNDDPDTAIQSLRRSVTQRLPSFARNRAALEAVILQAAG
jgi:homoserine kinase type II